MPRSIAEVDVLEQVYQEAIQVPISANANAVIHPGVPGKRIVVYHLFYNNTAAVGTTVLIWKFGSTVVTGGLALGAGLFVHVGPSMFPVMVSPEIGADFNVIIGTALQIEGFATLGFYDGVQN